MNNFEDKSNQEILFELKVMEADHEALKIKTIKLIDEMDALEKEAAKAKLTLMNRLKV